MINEKIKKVQNKKLHLVFNVSFVLFVFSLIVLIISIFNKTFANYYSNTFSAFLRKILSFVTGIFPFSVAEIILFLLPFWLFLLVFYIVRCIKRKTKVSTFFMTFFSVVFLLFFLFVNTFAVCYFRLPIEEQMGLERRALSRKELYGITLFLKQNLEDNLDVIEFSQDGASANPHNWKAVNDKLIKSYDDLNKDYKFLTKINAPAKKLFVSPFMTYTHISGIYIPFTSEANVNVNYPEYVTVYTIAHEMAHQRGIAGEDEANFAAFLACVNCDDDYIKYCGLMSMYDYFLDSLYENDEEMYKYIVINTDKRVLGEMYSYYKFFEKYSDSTASQVADTVNDTYLKTLGVEDGVKSYGKVVELYYAMYKDNLGLIE